MPKVFVLDDHLRVEGNRFDIDVPRIGNAQFRDAGLGQLTGVH